MSCLSRYFAKDMVFAQCRSIRRDRVSKPKMKLNDPNGLWHIPTSLKPSTRHRMMNATFTPSTPSGPNVSQNRSPWYPGDGSVNTGCLPFAQFMVPPSTITPPTVVPWPPIHFVADSTTISAPCFKGWHTYPPAPKVLSQITGMPYFSATAFRALKSGTEKRGFPIVSTYKHFVFASMSFSNDSGSSSAANLTLIPKRGRVTLNWLYDPP
mmetsp:Transcript_6451/g.24326  ORF Transcript_6451/g.24326 Transcript_6451/m.24326 type:complete len:210 (+) Transcript_6451:452-1081(+)